jgi:DNA uptake protein ComE-like DNA-binding protein
MKQTSDEEVPGLRAEGPFERIKQALQHPPAEQIQQQGPHDLLPDTPAIDLNHASREELNTVDFISEELAAAIVQERERRGGFTSWEQLQRVEGMDAKKVAELQRSARLGAP